MTTSYREMLRRVVHYIIARADNDDLSRTRLNKAVWFSDVTSLRRYGRTITGATSYQRLQYGPVPNEVLLAIKDLKTSGAIVDHVVETLGPPLRDFVSLKEPSMEGLTAQDVDVLNQVITWVCRRTAKQVSDATHTALWEEVALGEQIPVIAATVVEGEVTPERLAWAAKVFKRVEKNANRKAA
jgi:uncharacterized phage-associated protein